MKKVHLICNAHIDPVWQWEWEEGAAAAVSTFRAAADFCEEFDGFVFNHNEVILYQWVEEYEPQLFKRIQKLVAEKKWHIMGGWYLQPDCNMTSGESFVRQMLTGRQYFKEKFGVTPTTAINFDSFGHSRGLVQIMKKAGFDSYIFMRPDNPEFWMKPGDFIWEGFDGSEIVCHKIEPGYNSLMGMADQKIRDYIENHREDALGMVLWGVGNHGGGPSRQDLRNIAELMKQYPSEGVQHSTPEQYFHDLANTGKQLPRVARDINPRFPGCYTSQIRIKQKHRQLENELYMTEKMFCAAALQGLAQYPDKELKEAIKDLMTSEFHDILPGSSVQPVEETSLRLLDHGLEIVSRLKARAFFALASGQETAKSGEYPILIYNPHPYKVKGTFECEFMLADQNWKPEFSMPVVYQGDCRLRSQPEKELSNLNLDWRKRVVFDAELEPFRMNRFDCRIEVLPEKPVPELRAENGAIHFKTEDMEIVINCSTGLVDRYRVKGEDCLKASAFLPLVMEDNDDPWRMDTNRFDKIAGEFRLMGREAGTRFSGVREGLLESVRVIEDGAVRAVVEAVLHYGDSYICMTYRLPKQGTEFEVLVRVNWNEKSKMLKLSVPTAFEDADYIGQTAYGTDELPADGDEAVSQKWCAAVSKGKDRALTCVNDGVYGSSFTKGEIRLSLLRSPGYCAHPIYDRPILPQDRYLPRIDQGERLYTFRINAGPKMERLCSIDREALIFHEKPYTLSFFPAGQGERPASAILVENDTVLLTAFKQAENGEGCIIRLFNPTGEGRTTKVHIPVWGISQEVQLTKFEIKTLEAVKGKTELKEVSLLEE